MRVNQLLRIGEDRLAHTPDARWDARLLLMHALDIPQSAFIRHLTDEVEPEAAQRYLTLVARRAGGEPAQYILGKAFFMGLEYAVDGRVLIPRQDTELLCEAALAFAEKNGCQTALDLCTGSGALAIALAKLGGLEVTATDLSADALEVARGNAQRNGVAVRFRQGDLMEALHQEEKFDLIVCNPPYLTQKEMGELQEEVRREPALALLGGQDGLLFYRRLAQGAKEHLNIGGCLMMEIGCEQGGSVPALFNSWKTEVLKDLNGLDRVVVAVPIE